MGTEYRYVCRAHGADHELEKGDPAAFAAALGRAGALYDLMQRREGEPEFWHAFWGYAGSGAGAAEWLSYHGRCDVVLRDGYGREYGAKGEQVSCDDCGHHKREHPVRLCLAKNATTEAPCGCKGFRA